MVPSIRASWELVEDQLKGQRAIIGYQREELVIEEIGERYKLNTPDGQTSEFVRVMTGSSISGAFKITNHNRGFNYTLNMAEAKPRPGTLVISYITWASGRISATPGQARWMGQDPVRFSLPPARQRLPRTPFSLSSQKKWRNWPFESSIFFVFQYQHVSLQFARGRAGGFRSFIW